MSKQSLQISVHHYTDMLYTSIKGAQSMTLYSSRRLMNFWFFGKQTKLIAKQIARGVTISDCGGMEYTDYWITIFKIEITVVVVPLKTLEQLLFL